MFLTFVSVDEIGKCDHFSCLSFNLYLISLVYIYLLFTDRSELSFDWLINWIESSWEVFSCDAIVPFNVGNWQNVLMLQYVVLSTLNGCGEGQNVLTTKIFNKYFIIMTRLVVFISFTYFSDISCVTSPSMKWDALFPVKQNHGLPCKKISHNNIYWRT